MRSYTLLNDGQALSNSLLEKYLEDVMFEASEGEDTKVRETRGDNDVGSLDEERLKAERSVVDRSIGTSRGMW